jgi:sec-independent protein translocase protein TatB
MFDFSWAELMLIGAVALIVIGPKELPAVLRAVGQWTTKLRRMASEFQGQFQEAMREAEMADLKKEVDTLTDTAKGFTSGLASQFDPLKEATKWEPKVNSTADSTTDETKAREAPPASEAVTADGHSPPGAASGAPPITEPAPAPAATEPAPAASVATPNASPAATEHALAASEPPAPGASPAATEPASTPPVAPVPAGSGRA